MAACRPLRAWRGLGCRHAGANANIIGRRLFARPAYRFGYQISLQSHSAVCRKTVNDTLLSQCRKRFGRIDIGQNSIICRSDLTNRIAIGLQQPPRPGVATQFRDVT